MASSSAGNESDALLARVRDPSFTPAFRDLPKLIGLLGTDDEKVATAVERAVLRIESAKASRVLEGLVSASKKAVRPARARLAQLIGRLAQKSSDGVARAARLWLVAAVGDSDLKTRRAAMRALGNAKLPAGERAPVERALLDALDKSENDDDRRTLAVALGKHGTSAAKEKIAAVVGSAKSPATKRAALILDREEGRTQTAAIATTEAAEKPLPIRFHTREGLERVVLMELDPSWRARIVGPGIVSATLRGPLGRALAVRTALEVGFLIDDIPRDGDLAESVVSGLTSAKALSIFSAFTTPRDMKVRFRLAWARGGHRRALTWQCAELVREKTHVLLNDPTRSTWEVIVDDAGDHLSLELFPRGFVDERFAYRTETVPASSHPTIAAALALVAPRSADDVVWDPFVGSGAELVERAKLGPCAMLIGTDTDTRAIERARTNLRAAQVKASLVRGDATTFEPPRKPTLVLTNPPMGRRVERGQHTDVLSRFLAHASRVLAPGGALVWMAPEPKRIHAVADRVGLPVEKAFMVDMGGFPAALSLHRRHKTR